MISVNEKIELICNNINKYGLYRYDPRDIDECVGNIHNKKLRKVCSVILQLGEVFNPYFVRTIIGAKKRMYPTTFTFLADSQYAMEDCLTIDTAMSLMQRCIDEYYDGNGFWRFKINKTFFPLPSSKKSSMPLYMLCRCNNLIARLGNRYQNQQFVDIAIDSAEYMLKNHIITNYADGSESISYYYNSDECTINVNAEVVDWLSYLVFLSSSKREWYTCHIKEILRMIISEQNDDGSWDYYSKNTMKKYNLQATIDCHHTASTLYNLIHVYERKEFLPADIGNELLNSIKLGMKFFINSFFDQNGNGIILVGKKRKASTMQYSEALIALGEYLRVIASKVEYELYISILYGIVNNLVNLINDDGSAPGDIKIYPININNINWGNGAALYALCYFEKYLNR